MVQTELWQDQLENSRKDYLETARAKARKLLETREYITIDDVRKVCPPPEDIDPRVMGAVFNKVDFESIGWVQSRRITCHKRPIQRFRLKVKLPSQMRQLKHRGDEPWME